MAKPTCVKCGHETFEMMLVNMPETALTKYNFIQCANCGGVVAVVPVCDIAADLAKIRFAIDFLAAKMDFWLDWNDPSKSFFWKDGPPKPQADQP